MSRRHRFPTRPANTPARATLAAYERVTGWPATDSHEPSLWLRTALARHRDELLDGPSWRPCRHVLAAAVAGADAPPTVMHAALWLPGVVVCADCMGAGALRVGGDEDWRCDRCGAVKPGECTPLMVATAPWLLVSLGLCDRCRGRELGGAR